MNKPFPKPAYKLRPNTRKIYETYWGVKLPGEIAVHHVLPVRFGGTHDVKNLVSLTREQHAEAHLELYRKFGDKRDLCASYMILGRTEEWKMKASSMGGKASAVAKRLRGEKMGFQLFSAEKRKTVAAAAGKIGGTVQYELGIGIHVDEEQRKVWASLGGLKSAEVNGFHDSARQSERGKKGGVKNKGSRYYRDDDNNLRRYSAKLQIEETFEDFIARTGFSSGIKSVSNEDKIS